MMKPKDYSSSLIYQAKLSKDIRTTRKEKEETAKRLSDVIKKLDAKCKHQHVIILRSNYEGSYSWDYDDWHPETRMCLICGELESATKKEKFHTLLKPFARFELSNGATDDKHPILKDIFKSNLKDLIKYCQENGYRV